MSYAPLGEFLDINTLQVLKKFMVLLSVNLGTCTKTGENHKEHVLNYPLVLPTNA
jgi:hypothetical protein